MAWELLEDAVWESWRKCMHPLKILNPKRKWHGIAKQKGERGSYTKQFSPFFKRSSFVCKSKVQRFINSGRIR